MSVVYENDADNFCDGFFLYCTGTVSRDVFLQPERHHAIKPIHDSATDRAV